MSCFGVLLIKHFKNISDSKQFIIHKKKKTPCISATEEKKSVNWDTQPLRYHHLRLKEEFGSPSRCLHYDTNP